MRKIIGTSPIFEGRAGTLRRCSGSGTNEPRKIAEGAHKGGGAAAKATAGSEQ